MPRRPRACPAGVCFHVLNRAVARLPLFNKAADYRAFESVMEEAYDRVNLPILAYCVMPNHWHFVVRPKSDHQVTDFFRWLTNTHTMRWHAHHGTGGTGHLYQGRFKSFPIEEDEHLLVVLRYVERNALRAGLCDRAEDWQWGSLWGRDQATKTDFLADWPLPRPKNWRSHVNKPQSESELQALRKCVQRCRPFGNEDWVCQAATRMKLTHTLRPPGRPKKSTPR
ncbi:hypothetical protein FYK55_00010 [Roseiconus nitratireducens]|uniref:Transposase IS200-like domain-containing protein n=1 Tax=Roseiconus nitratireducens TaxID=2605748 RepID=A0A5M6DH23_9BACT|nr:transposase [Roseiconus nitratireducens]KAA5546854.1 hypothetical protein FYK55_00010 [Roseiconus nitratireducens]